MVYWLYDKGFITWRKEKWIILWSGLLVNFKYQMEKYTDKFKFSKFQSSNDASTTNTI